MGQKPYTCVPIHECGEPLAPIPAGFVRLSPHPYQRVGAPYGNASPFWLRVGVITALEAAQVSLMSYGWRLAIFDAYRPVAVQQFMVEYTFRELCTRRDLNPQQIDASLATTLWEQVYLFWAIPSQDPQQPPPHSTGAAVDLTLIDETGTLLDMGGAIDELSERSYPDFYDRHPHLAHAKNIAERRQRLNQAMSNAGFQRHPNEWWHFSLGDQLWAWQTQQQTGQSDIVARYGRIDFA
ncbi:M15 family metallopeptidase [Parathermosynechococcus lividus]